MGEFRFPAWIDRSRPLVGMLLLIVPAYAVAMVYYGGSPRTTDVGYSPKQPIPYSHALHVGKLGLDCRYCHTAVETANHMPVPPTATCMNCHQRVAVDSPKLAPLRESAATGKPVHWVRVHDLPDYVYFDHSAHVTRGIGCVSCHGRIDTMEQVYQVNTLSMGWCLDCHRNPLPNLRPADKITQMTWQPGSDQAELGKQLSEQYHTHPSTDCSTCHR
jgi:hypothetical protein